MVLKPMVRILAVLFVVIALGAVALVPATPVLAGVELGFDVRFTGVITTVGGTGAAWVIGGQTVATDANTNVLLTVSPAKVGLWADVAAKRQTDGSLLAKQITVRPEQVRLRGIVTSKPNTEGAVGEWVVAGVTINVTADTKINKRSGSTDVDHWVEVVMTEDGGVLTALLIMGIHAQDLVEVSGEIQSFADDHWVLSSMQLDIDADTLISGKPGVGLIGRAAAELQEDGSLLAKGLRVAWIDKNALLPMVDFTGVIEKMPASGLKGEWTVDGKAVVVMPNTRLNQEKGLAVVGATVNVIGWDAFDKVIASQITVVSSPQAGGAYTRVLGLVEALPEGGPVGVWTIAGQKVEVTAQTELRLPADKAPEVGWVARVEGVKRTSDNVVVAAYLYARPAVTVTPPPRPTRPPRP